MSEMTKTEDSKKTVVTDLPTTDKELTDAEKKQLIGGKALLGSSDCAVDQHTTGSTSCDTLDLA